MSLRRGMVAIAAVLCFGTAQAVVIDFEADAAGGKANGFSAVGFPGVTFTDTSGANLNVNNYDYQSGNTKGLGVFNDDGSALRIDFATRQSALSMSFGNDDGVYHGGTVFALLELFDGVTLVASNLMQTNSNDIMDEIIGASFAGGFNNARFTYTDSRGAAINLIEIVDNIEARVAVPLPGTLTLVGLGLLGLGASRRRT